MKMFVVTYSITGIGSATVLAETKEEAEQLAKELEVSYGEVVEWNFNDVLKVEEV